MLTYYTYVSRCMNINASGKVGEHLQCVENGGMHSYLGSYMVFTTITGQVLSLLLCSLSDLSLRNEMGMEGNGMNFAMIFRR